MCDVYYLTLDKLSVISEALAATVTAGYGPCFKNTLVTTSTGKLLMTNSGLKIVRSLAVDHPCARLIVDCVRRHQDITGDNTKSFLLLLNELLRIARFRAASDLQQPQSLVAGSELPLLASEMAFATTHILPKLLRRLHESAHVYTTQNLDDFKCGLLNIIRGSLNCHLLDYDALSLSTLVRDYLVVWCVNLRRLQHIMELLINHFDVLCVQCANKPAASSRFVSGMLLSRSCFLGKRSIDTAVRLGFIILACHIEPREEVTSNVTLLLDALPDRADSAFLVKTERIRQFLEQCIRAGVNLILTTNVFTELEKSECDNYGLFYVHAIPEEEAMLLATIAAVPLIHDAAECLLNGVLPTVVGHADGCEEVAICGGNYTRLVGLRTAACNVSTLILCGPTEGLCQQVYETVRNTFKSVRESLVARNDHSRCCMNSVCEQVLVEAIAPLSRPPAGPEAIPVLNSDTPELGICAFPAGGTFEVAVHHLILQHLSSVSTNGHVTALRVLADAVLTIPRTLHDNAYSFSKPRWPVTLLDLKAACLAGEVRGVHAASGSSAKLSELHPFKSKQLLLLHVISLANQLLKTDIIMPASATIKRSTAGLS